VSKCVGAIAPAAPMLRKPEIGLVPIPAFCLLLNPHSLSHSPATLLQAKQKADAMIQQARRNCEAWHKRMDEYERDYFQLNTGDTSSRGGEKVRLPDIPIFADHAAAILQTGSYKLSLDRPGDLQPDKKTAGAAEGYMRAVVSHNAALTGEQIEKSAPKLQTQLGAVMLHWLYTHDGIVPPLNNPPVEMYAVDARKVYLTEGRVPNGRFEVVCHKEHWTVGQVYKFLVSVLPYDEGAWEQFGRKYGYLMEGDSDPVTWNEQKSEFWNIWAHEYLPPQDTPMGRTPGQWVVTNTLMYEECVFRAFEVMHHYDHIPWEIVPAKDTGHKDFEHRWLPLWYHGRSLVRTLERIQGQMYDQMQDIAQMPFVAVGGPNHEEPPDVTGGPSNVVKLFYGQEFRPPQFGTLMRDLYPQAEMVQERISRTLFPPSMYGAGSSGQHSGYAFDMSHEGGKLRLVEPRDHLAFGFKRMFTGITSLIARHLTGIPIYATYHKGATAQEYEAQEVVLLGEDLYGWNIKVEWQAVMPGDEQRQAAQLNMLSNFLPLEDLLEKTGLAEDPHRAAELKFAEEIRKSEPETRQAAALRLMREMELGSDPMESVRDELVKKGDEIYARALITAQLAGAPNPQTAELLARHLQQRYFQSQLQQMQMALMQPQGAPPPQGQPPQGTRGQGQPQPQPNPGQPPSPTNNAPRPPGERVIRDPRTGVQSGLRNSAPPGNPADVARPLREAANQLNPGSIR
jgi:hypothetical protein